MRLLIPELYKELVAVLKNLKAEKIKNNLNFITSTDTVLDIKENKEYKIEIDTLEAEEKHQPHKVKSYLSFFNHEESRRPLLENAAVASVGL